MKTQLAASALAIVFGGALHASEESKTWDASDEARQSVKDTIVLGILASPYRTGWTGYDQLHTYFERARDNGTTGHEMTLAAADMSFETLLEQHYHFRAAMTQQPENYLVVNETRDIEAAPYKAKPPSFGTARPPQS